MMKRFAVFAGFFIAVLFAQTQTIRYVALNGTGDGSSWASAAGDIQSMLKASALGDQVWIAGGTYSLAATLQMKNGVNVYGGFLSGDTAVTDRVKHDLDGNGTTEEWEFVNTTVLDGQNARQVLIQISSFTVETVWDGVTITGGQGGIGNAGSGAYIKRNGTLRNCIISGNSISASAHVAGGGVYSDSGTVSYCLARNNQISTSAASANAAGGGIYSKGGVINYCTVDNNTVSTISTSALASGGGIYNEGGTVNNCIVESNTVSTIATTALASGGGIYNKDGIISNSTINGNTVSAMTATRASGGGIYNDNAIVSFCIVSNNTVTTNITTSDIAGGGIACVNTTNCIINDCTIANNKTVYKNTAQYGYGGGVYSGNINRCIIKGNSASSGGGICQSLAKNSLLVNNNAAQYGGGGIDCSVINCTFVENQANNTGGGGGLFGTSIATATATNCIFWKNTANMIGSQIYSPPPTTLTVTYSAVQGGFTGTGNISIASDNATGPQFVNPTAGNYQLQENSPCVNAGNNSGLSATDTDLAGNPRIYGEKVDMGAYELQNFSVTGISLSPKKITLVIGDSVKVTASVVPYYAANQNITITNIDTAGVAYIANNTIYATLLGTTRFVFTTEEGGFSDTCIVTVEGVGINNYELPITDYVVYPNPTTGKLTITNYGSTSLTDQNRTLSGAEVEIYDIMGRKQKIESKRQNNEILIDISRLPNGLYFININNRVIKVVKTKT